MKTLITISIALLLAAPGCRTDPGASDYDAQEPFPDAGADIGEAFLEGPDPWSPGEKRLFLGVFYEAPSGFSEVKPLNNLTSFFFLFEQFPDGPLTCTVDGDSDRVEGFESSRVRHAGATFWGLTIAWLTAPPPAGTPRPDNLSLWETMHISLKSGDAAFADVDISLTDYNEILATVSARDYGYTNDGEWHSLEIPMSDFVDAGLDLEVVVSPIALSGGEGNEGEALLVDNLFLDGTLTATSAGRGPAQQSAGRVRPNTSNGAVMATQTATSGLGFKEKLGYGVGDTASHFVWDMVGFWLLVFYTDTLGISTAAAGTIMLVARIWDMVTDPVMGVISDRTNTRWGKFRPYLLWMAVPYAILAVMAFSTPDFSPSGKAIYAGVTYMLLMTVFTAINLPYSSLAGVMTSDSQERTTLNQYRFVCAFGGQLIVSGIALTLVGVFGGEDTAKGYQWTIILFAAVSIVLFYITFISTKERVQPPRGQTSNLKADFRNLIKTRPWVILFAVGVCSFTLFALQNAVTAFYFKYYINDAEQAQLFNVIGALALIAAIPLAKPLSKRFGNRNVFFVCSLLTGFWYIMMFLPSAENIELIYTINILGKISYAPTVPLLWTMIADTADYSEWKSGRRATGLFFSAATLSMKFGWGIGGALAGYLLAGFGYVANQAQTEHALTGIRLMMTVFPGLLYIIAAVLLIFYNITPAIEREMKVDLDARREAEEAEAAAEA